MKKTVYDFSDAVEYIRTMYDPTYLSSMLKDAALKLSILDSQGTSVIADMQIAVMNATEFLEAITEKEIEQ